MEFSNFSIFFWQAALACCIWRDSPDIYYANTHVCSPVREHVFLLVTFIQKIADVQDPSNNFIANTPLGFRRAVPCYRTTTWWRLDGTSRDCLVQQPCSKQAQLKQLAQAVSSWVCNTWKDGDSATSLACSLFSHCHRGEKKKKLKGKKKIFLLFKWNFLCSVCAHCLLYFYWASLNRVWLCLPYSLLDKITPAIQPQVSYPLLIYARCSKRWPFLCAHSSLVLGSPALQMRAHTDTAWNAVGLLCCKGTTGLWSTLPPRSSGLS